MIAARAFRFRPLLVVSVALALAAGVVGAVPAASHPEQPRPQGVDATTGADGGNSHLENPRRRIREIGFNPIDNEGFNTDIMPWLSQSGGVYTATGTWGTVLNDPTEDCPSETDVPVAPQKSGVKILRATDPSNPVEVARLGTVNGSQNNDVKVKTLPTTLGTRDILVHSLEPCGVEGLLHQVPGSPFVDVLFPILGTVELSATGFHVYDVTDPENPVFLGKWNNGGIGTHNLWLFEQGRRSFVAAVWNRVDFFGVQDEEFVTGELQIVEITNPTTPVLVGRWALEDGPGKSGLNCPARGTDSQNCFLHDVTVSDDGKIAYLSFWDAGLILLDVSRPGKPRFLGRALGQVQDRDPRGWLNEEGNTHAAVPLHVDGRHLVVVGDEDFTGGARPGFRVDAPAELAGFNEGVQWSGTGRVSGQTGKLVYAGTGCSPASYAPVAAEIQGNIALVDDRRSETNPADRCPTYTFFQKMQSAEEAGAIGLIQIPREGDEPFKGDAIRSEIPGIEVFRTDRVLAVRAAVIGGTEVRATLERGGEIDPWGFMRVVDVTQLRDPATWREVSTWAAPHVFDPDPDPEDVFSAHNPVVGPKKLIYFSWYTDGVRVLQLSKGGAVVSEVAWFVPRASDHPNDNDTDPHGAQEANVGFWGSWPLCRRNTGQLLIFNSDLNRGVYVLEGQYPSCGG